MRVRLGNGIELNCGEKILLDPIKTQADIPSLISHAHSDHVPRDIRNPKGKIYATEGTASILRSRYGADNVEVVHYGERIGFGAVDVYPYPAGHIFGSSGFLIICDGTSLFYTGDTNPYGGLTVESPARIPEVDVLILESTYGNPRYRFPDPQRIRIHIAKWAVEEVSCGRSPVIEAYLVGKSQEVIALLNRYTNLEVVVSEPVARVSEAFRKKFNLKFTRHSNGPHVLVTHRAAGENKARVTGWALFSRRRGDFPLSAHADFDGLVNIVVSSSPNKILTVYGFKRELANWLKKWGLDAQPLGGNWVEL